MEFTKKALTDYFGFQPNIIKCHRTDEKGWKPHPTSQIVQCEFCSADLWGGEFTVDKMKNDPDWYTVCEECFKKIIAASDDNVFAGTINGPDFTPVKSNEA